MNNKVKLREENFELIQLRKINFVKLNLLRSRHIDQRYGKNNLLKTWVNLTLYS